MDRNGTAAERLFFEIAHCEVAGRQVENQAGHSPCATIVAAQGYRTWANFHIPEPWSGNLLTAPVLFLSSNPSISEIEAYPTGSWQDPELWNFFNERFAGTWIRDGKQARNLDGSYGKPVSYWSSIRNRATELLNRAAVPGVDFALSEIVHCKSKGEVGVPAAINECAARYLMRLLSCSPATVLVLVGRKTLNYWNSLRIESVPPVPERDGTELQPIAGRNRVIVFLPHPTGPEPKRFCSWVSGSAMEKIRSALLGNT